MQSTKGHEEGAAVGFNKAKKGARSYYPLFCTVAQTGQFFDVHHRPGNVHDSNGAAQFMLDDNHVKFTASVPFERFTQLKKIISQEIQMPAHPSAPKALAIRPVARQFEKLDTIRHRIIQRAGRIIRPNGKLTLSMSVNQAAQKDLMHFLDMLQKAA